MILILILAAGLNGQVRPAYVAGTFYPADPVQLRKMVETFLREASPPEVTGKIKGLICPHAGYIYSGKIAAAAYKAVRGEDYETVIIFGPSHRYGFAGGAVYDKGYYSTPLGKVKIDEELAARMIRGNFGYFSGARYHAYEHSIEVQIPFLQIVLPNARILPIVIGPFKKERLLHTAGKLAKLLKGKKVLIIASSDLSHYHTKSAAYKKDSYTIKLILSFKPKTFLRQAERMIAEACGAGPIALTQEILKKLGVKKAVLLARGDSADAGGPTDRVVGYASIAFYIEKKNSSRKNIFKLSREEKNYLLTVARRSVKYALEGKDYPLPEPPTARLKEKGAAFVTIRKKGHLRGCIGYIKAVEPLYKTVKIAALMAAFRDPRFPPLRKEEFKEVKFEISVLSKMRPSSPAGVVVGKHGILLYYRGASGLLLPQVATENGWTREEFLSNTCLKAGVAPDCWRKGAKIYVFEAEVFEEE